MVTLCSRVMLLLIKSTAKPIPARTATTNKIVPIINTITPSTISNKIIHQFSDFSNDQFKTLMARQNTSEIDYVL